ncbi:MAG: hypothetical protein Q9213_002097 [Squamulea squamosa]
MMYHVTDTSLAHPWVAGNWRSEIGPSGIHLKYQHQSGKDLSHLFTQYVIWGLNHLMLSMYLSRQFCHTSAKLIWRGDQVGTIIVTERASLGFAPDTKDQTGTAQTGHQLGSGGMTANEDVEVFVKFRGHTPIDRQLIYLTAIKAMGEAAEIGLEHHVKSLSTMGIQRVSWRLVSGTETFTGPLTPGHSRNAIIEALAVMIHDHRFQNTDVWVKVHGQDTAFGGFSQNEALSSL